MGRYGKTILWWLKNVAEITGAYNKNGELDAFTKGEYVDEFFEATKALKDGEYTKKPVESTYGYHIIYRISATKKPSMKEAEEDILEGIVTNKLSNDDNLSTLTWIDIRKSYGLDIADSKVKKAYEESVKAQKNQSNKDEN